MFVCFYIVCHCFCATTAELSGWHRDPMAHKAKTFYCMALYQTSLPTAVLEVTPSLSSPFYIWTHWLERFWPRFTANISLGLSEFSTWSTQYERCQDHGGPLSVRETAPLCTAHHFPHPLAPCHSQLDQQVGAMHNWAATYDLNGLT